MDWKLNTIGVLHSPCKEKFAVPRQSGLAPELNGRIEILKPFDREEAFIGLDGFSHIWVLGIFHLSRRDEWRPTVRPPRLGGNERVGVFASRAPYRPNPVSLSVFRYHGLGRYEGKLMLSVSGLDLVDATPIIDIKPYLAYADMPDVAEGGYTDSVEKRTLRVHFSTQAQQQCQEIARQNALNLRALIHQLISLDPRPAYQQDSADKHYGVNIANYNVSFIVSGDCAQILNIEPVS